MPGLLDDFAGGLLLGKPKKLPPDVAGGALGPRSFPGQIANPEALAQSLHHDIPTIGGPNRFTDAPPGAKIQGRLPEGLPMTGPPVPVAGGPSSVGAGGGPSLLDPNSIAGAQPTLPRPPQFAQAPQFPTPPPALRPQVTPGGNPAVTPPSPQLTPGGNPSLTPPPNPIIPPKIGPPPAIAAPPPITPTPPPIAPTAPPPISTAAAPAAAGAAAGAGAGLGGVFSALAGIAKGLTGQAAPAPPPAKAPTIQPMSQDPRSASRAQGAQQAMQGLLGGSSLIDPRKRQGLV